MQMQIAPQETKAVQAETASTALAAQAKALVEARYLVAINRPRDMDAVREKLLKDCKRPGFARSAIYHKPIGKGVEGPSIRFAESAIRAMGNIIVNSPTTYEDHEKRIINVSVCDLESNTAYDADVMITKTVERNSLKEGEKAIRTRIGARGQTVHIVEATDDDILNKANALVSKAVRTLGLRLLPGDILDECMWACRQTQKDEDARDPDSAKLQLFDAFGTIGVKVAALKEWLGHDGETITPKELGELRGIYSAIRDSETTWKAVMEAKFHKKAEGAADLAEMAARASVAANVRAEGAKE